MDLVDEFVRDAVFSKHRHRQFFSDGETPAEREQWLREVDAICKASQTSYVVRETTDDHGNPGYEFGFTDRGAHAAFVLNVFGDLEEPHAHIQACSMDNESREYREAFLLAASSHLAALGISHQWREHEGQLQFAFDRFSDQLMFETLIEQGVIDASARGIVFVRAMQQRLGLKASQAEIVPGFDPS